jgi:hypothetical protein
VWEGSAVLPLFEVHPEFLEGEITVMPLMPGTLADHQAIFASQALHYSRRVATALEFCHGRAVVHGDVKPSNVFMTQQGGVLLGDFGVRDFIPGGLRGHTLEYAAPDLIAGSGRSPSSDVWATAVLLYQLVCGALPFGSRNADDEGIIAGRISNCTYTHPDTVTPYLPRRVRRLFESCFVPDPNDREVRTAEQFRTAVSQIVIRTEWVRYSRPGYTTIWEGHELDQEGRRTGIRYEARLRHLPRLGLWEADIAKDAGAGMRRLMGVTPFRGSEAQARQKMVVWMRRLSEHGSP